MKKLTHSAAALSLLFIPFAVACHDDGRAGQVSDKAAAVEPERPDALLTAKVKAQLAADAEVNPFEIEVTTEDGVVTLTGTVDETIDRERAEHLARTTVGVRSVVNRLEVQRRDDMADLGDKVEEAADEAGDALASGGEALTDAAITAAVKTKLLAADHLDGLEINVDTDNGVVSLNGKVKTRDQKLEAERLARETNGVRDTVNNLEILG